MANPDNTNASDITTENYDAQQLTEEIKKDKDKAPQVNADADYERSKQFDVADIDRTAAGSKAAAAATDSKATRSNSPSEAGEPTGDPDAFRKMAKEVNPPAEK